MTQSQAEAVPVRQKRRDRIVDVAVDLFSTLEYEDVSVDELCRQAGVAKGLAFYHFGDKRGIFAAAVHRVWEELIAYQQPLPEEDTPTARMHGYLHRHFAYVERHPRRFSILMVPTHGSADVRETVVTLRWQAAAEIAASLACPTDPAPRLRQAIYSWIGFVDCTALDWLAHRDTDVDHMTDLCTQALIAAVRAANGLVFDFEAELEALAQLTRAPQPQVAKANFRPKTGAKSRKSPTRVKGTRAAS
jgi:AcrR family transcriptional regulator